jgi:hypothetical protein
MKCRQSTRLTLPAAASGGDAALWPEMVAFATEPACADALLAAGADIATMASL